MYTKETGLSNKDDIDKFSIEIDEEAWQRSKDKYLQLIIEKLDDPDYDRVPLLLDGETIIYPDGANFIDIVKLLQAATKWAKEQVFKNGDT